MDFPMPGARIQCKNTFLQYDNSNAKVIRVNCIFELSILNVFPTEYLKCISHQNAVGGIVNYTSPQCDNGAAALPNINQYLFVWPLCITPI